MTRLALPPTPWPERSLEPSFSGPHFSPGPVKQARGFYALILLSTVVAVGLDFAGINPVRALYWAAVIKVSGAGTGNVQCRAAKLKNRLLCSAFCSAVRNYVFDCEQKNTDVCDSVMRC